MSEFGAPTTLVGSRAFFQLDDGHVVGAMPSRMYFWCITPNGMDCAPAACSQVNWSERQLSQCWREGSRQCLHSVQRISIAAFHRAFPERPEDYRPAEAGEVFGMIRTSSRAGSG
jgi:hypothetical protein